MKRTYFRIFTMAALCMIMLASCIKDPLITDDNSQCLSLTQIHTHSFTPIVKGEEITIGVDSVRDASYSWTGPNNYQSYSQNNTVTSYAEYYHKGWYYVHVTHAGCNESGFDSVYVDVKFPQGQPPCTPTNNIAAFNSNLLLGDQSFYYVTFGAAMGGYGITGNSSNGDISITMSPYWNSHDLEDGIYYTSSNQLPEYSDLDKVFMSDVNQNIYWVAAAGNPVYISHASGKRRITFCGVDFSGDWGGTLYHATVDAQITEP